MRGVKQHEPPIAVFIPPFVGENERDLESFCGYDGTDKLASLINVCYLRRPNLYCLKKFGPSNDVRKQEARFQDYVILIASLLHRVGSLPCSILLQVNVNYVIYSIFQGDNFNPRFISYQLVSQ